MGTYVDRGFSTNNGDENTSLRVRSGDVVALDLLLKVTDDAGVVCDESGLIVALNERAARFIGRARVELLGKPFDVIFPLRSDSGPQGARANDRWSSCSLYTGDTARRVEVRRLSLSGLTSQDSVLFLLRDLGEREEVRSKAARLGSLSTLSALVSRIAHDINNPLTSSIGSVDLARTALDRVRQESAFTKDPRLERVTLLLDTAQHGAERVAQLVADLRALGRGSEGAPEEAVDVTACVDDALRLVMSGLRNRARVVRDTRAHPTVTGRPHALRQVFCSILLNAAESIDEGTMGEIRVLVDEQGPHALVSISDTGTGIAPSDLPHVFEPFFSTHPQTAPGLGLTASQHILEQMNGTIEIESLAPQGTCVSIRLPKQGKSRTISTPPPAHVVRGPAIKVLLVDDELSLGTVLAELLVDEGYEVTVSSSAEQALVLLDEAKDYDVILCDVMMPGMDGIELYEQMLSREPALAGRFVFMTGGSVSQRMTQFLTATSQPWLSKPLDVRKLSSLLATISERARARATPS